MPEPVKPATTTLLNHDQSAMPIDVGCMTITVVMVECMVIHQQKHVSAESCLECLPHADLKPRDFKNSAI
jgi:hypothetical protein